MKHSAVEQGWDTVFWTWNGMQRSLGLDVHGRGGGMVRFTWCVTADLLLIQLVLC